MNLTDYYQEKNSKIFFSRQQASDFAKKIANDFNPIHDVDAKKFCVPGDLIFAVILQKYGLAQQMNFSFSGMVANDIFLDFPNYNAKPIQIKDEQDKEYLNFDISGDISHDQKLISTFIQAYVQFSGKAFPHLLVPLMQQENIMINPTRPLVIYESMSVQLDRLDIKNLQVELFQTGIDVQGKRGKVCLEFEILCHDKKIGCGKKNMILSGLRAFDEPIMNELIEEYQQRSLIV